MNVSVPRARILGSVKMRSAVLYVTVQMGMVVSYVSQVSNKQLHRDAYIVTDVCKIYDNLVVSLPLTLILSCTKMGDMDIYVNDKFEPLPASKEYNWKCKNKVSALIRK